MSEKKPKSKEAKKHPEKVKQNFDIKAVLGRYHGIIYTILTGLGLSVAVFMLFTVVTESSNTEGHTPSAMNTSFDQETTEKVNQLQPLSKAPRSVSLPDDGRINPFRN